MNDFEQHLRSVPLAAPSATLDRAMTDAFLRASEHNRGRLLSRMSGWRWLMMSGAGVTAAVLVLQLFKPVEPPPIVHVVEAEGRLRDLLVNSSRKPQAIPRFVATTDGQ